jgi:hypothetical protein
MGLTLIEAAKYESRLEHLAVIKTFAEGELLSWLPFMNIAGGMRRLIAGSLPASSSSRSARHSGPRAIKVWVFRAEERGTGREPRNAAPAWPIGPL